MMQATGGNSFWRMMAHYMVGVVIALGLMSMAQARAAEVKVMPDEASLVAVAGKPAAIIVGNPLYAQIAVVTNNKLLVQGRNPGRTNVIVLDVDGNRLAEFDVVVTGRGQDEISVYRRGTRLSYNCAPDCSRVPGADDSAAALANLNKRIMTRTGLIQGSTK